VFNNIVFSTKSIFSADMYTEGAAFNIFNICVQNTGSVELIQSNRT
jgi:hypothetical protein